MTRAVCRDGNYIFHPNSVFVQLFRSIVSYIDAAADDDDYDDDDGIADAAGTRCFQTASAWA